MIASISFDEATGLFRCEGGDTRVLEEIAKRTGHTSALAAPALAEEHIARLEATEDPWSYPVISLIRDIAVARQYGTLSPDDATAATKAALTKMGLLS